jgi:hypothetical protein
MKMIKQQTSNKLRDLSPRTNLPTKQAPLVGEVNANFLQIEGCRVVSAANPYGRILGFLDQSRYYFFQVAPQLYSRG